MPVDTAHLAQAQISNLTLIDMPDANHVRETPAGNKHDKVVIMVGEFLLA